MLFVKSNFRLPGNRPKMRLSISSSRRTAEHMLAISSRLEAVAVSQDAGTNRMNEMPNQRDDNERRRKRRRLGEENTRASNFTKQKPTNRSSSPGKSGHVVWRQIQKKTKKKNFLANLLLITLLDIFLKLTISSTLAIDQAATSPFFSAASNSLPSRPLQRRHAQATDKLAAPWQRRSASPQATAAVASAGKLFYRTTLDEQQQQSDSVADEREQNNEDKILFLHSQLNLLKRQLELELNKKSHTQTQLSTNSSSRETTPAITQTKQSLSSHAAAVMRQLGSPCLRTSDCNQSIKFSHCNLDNFTCSCLREHTQLNSSVCLPPALLGYECTLDAQCQQRVPDSICQAGKCACRADKAIAYRKNKCLSASKINDYCLADGQCQLNDKHSFCKWKIQNVYGTCKCPPNYKLLTVTSSSGGGDESTNKTNTTTHLKCAPRLGDTCLSDQDCQQVTPNSICSNALSRTSSTWLSSSASGAKCTCARDFDWSASQLECIRVRQLDAATNSNNDEHQQRDSEAAAKEPLDSHKYETVINNSKEQQQEYNSTTSRPIIEERKSPSQQSSSAEPEIKFVPLAGSFTTKSTATTTTTTTKKPTTTQRAQHELHHVDEDDAKATSQLQGKMRNSNSSSISSRFRMSSLGKACSSRQECQARDPYSDCVGGVCECQMPTERCRAASRGCHANTFQCHNGQCISWYFVCDGFKNCDDGSDEEACHAAAHCPPEAFKCHSDGACVTRGKICNGARDCADGSDELGCQAALSSASHASANSSSCPENSFTCYDGQCLPAYVFCNAVVDCADASDEDERVCERGSSPVNSNSSLAVFTNLRHRPTSKPLLLSAAVNIRKQAVVSPAMPSNSSELQAPESPLVKTDRASIQRLMATLALSQQRTPPEKPRGRTARLLGAPDDATNDKKLTSGHPATDECPKWAFTCRNGKCRSSAILCSGVDGCGDNSDEDQCEVCQCEPPPRFHARAKIQEAAAARSRVVPSVNHPASWAQQQNARRG